MDRQGTPSRNAFIGAEGERIAATYLERLGYAVLDRNWRCRDGELDLIAKERDTLIGIEVKTRTGDRYGSPLQAITATKARRLRRLLAQWLRTHHTTARAARIDAIGITLRDNASPRIDHLRGLL